MEVNPAHPPATTLQFCVFGEDFTMAPLLPLESVCSILISLVTPSLPFPTPLQTTNNDFLYYLSPCVFSLFYSLQPLQPPSHHYLISPLATPLPPLSVLATPQACWEPSLPVAPSQPQPSGSLLSSQGVVATAPSWPPRSSESLYYISSSWMFI